MTVTGIRSTYADKNIENRYWRALSMREEWLYNAYCANARWLISGELPEKQTSIIIPDGTTKIKANAYKDQQIFSMPEYIPESVTEIGDYAFYGTAIPQYRNSNTQTSLVLPSTLKSVGNYAFFSRSTEGNYLGILDIGAQNLGGAVFLGWIGDLVVRNTLQSVSSAPLASCTIRDSVIIEPGLTYFPPILSGCLLYSFDVVIPETVTDIAPLAFVGTSEAYFQGTRIIIPGSVKTIKTNTFASQLQSRGTIVFSEGVEVLEPAWATQMCQFNEVHIPSTVISLDNDTFARGNISSINKLYINRPEGYFDTSSWTTKIGEIIWIG